MPDPIYPVGRREDGVREVPQVQRQRLLSPTEREDARRKRQAARRKVDKERPRTAGEPAPQVHHGGADYLA
jgi:hypothetical protein